MERSQSMHTNEISIQLNVTYDRKDTICSFEDWGNKRINKFEDHVLVFMLRGLNTDWRSLSLLRQNDKRTIHMH